MYVEKQLDTSSSSSSSLNITGPFKTPRSWRADKALAGRSVRWIIVTCCEILAGRWKVHVTISRLLVGGFGTKRWLCNTLSHHLQSSCTRVRNKAKCRNARAENAANQVWPTLKDRTGKRCKRDHQWHGMAPMAMNWKWLKDLQNEQDQPAELR